VRRARPEAALVDFFNGKDADALSGGPVADRFLIPAGHAGAGDDRFSE
jgi:hypothetical protein